MLAAAVGSGGELACGFGGIAGSRSVWCESMLQRGALKGPCRLAWDLSLSFQGVCCARLEAVWYMSMMHARESDIAGVFRCDAPSSRMCDETMHTRQLSLGTHGFGTSWHGPDSVIHI